MKFPIVLIGGGGHCRSCIDVIEQEDKYRIDGIVDVSEKLHQKILGYEIIATDADLPNLIEEYTVFMITVGQIESPEKRITLFKELKRLGAKLAKIVSPLAYVSSSAKVGEGTIVMHQALVNAGAQVGQNCIINTKVLIEHDTRIGDHCHISTGSVVNGGVRIGHGTFFGSNAVTREYIEIGDNCVIGVGGRITRNVASNSVIRDNYKSVST